MRGPTQDSRAIGSSCGAPEHPSRLNASPLPDVCAKLVTVKNGYEQVIWITLDKPAILGRNPALCTYVIQDKSVSGLHCKFFAVRSPQGGVIVSCQDLSMNGIVLNSHTMRKTSMIITDGDVIKIPHSLSFQCFHLWKDTIQKVNFFDPTPPPQPAYKRIGRYTVTSQCLGSGSFATVHLALDPTYHCQVACKSIRTKKDSEVGQVTKEIAILAGLKHPNINRIYASEQNGNFIHIFLQLCTGGDLFTYITSYTDKGTRICEAEAKYLMFQMLQAIVYLHDKQIAHRDLKPENVLLHIPGPYPRVMIADFGLARPRSYQETFNVCGTVSYLPPEGILALDQKHLGYIGMPSDCWSLGVILYIMLSGAHPFDYDGHVDSADWISRIKDSRDLPDSQYSESYISGEARLKERIINGELDLQRFPWDFLKDAKALVSQLLHHDYHDRATVHGALESRWIKQDITELNALYTARILTTLGPMEAPTA